MTEDRTPCRTDFGTDAPAAARVLFGARLELAAGYGRLLAGDGVRRGLIGPREVDRIWERHLLNSAVLADLLPMGARVVDVGAGAGLPGVPIAIRRPDLRVDLVEPMQRRVLFLEEVVAELGLGETVRVVRGRAEEAQVRTTAGDADWVVARAVAPLDRLVRWCLPLLAQGGTLLALKGARAAEEVAEHRRAVAELGGRGVEVVELGAEVLPVPARVIVVRRGPAGRTWRGRA